MNKKAITFAIVGLSSLFGLVSCNKGGSTPTPASKFDFSPSLASGRAGTVYLGDTDTIQIQEFNIEAGKARSYTYTVDSDWTDYISVSTTGLITPLQVTPAGEYASIAITENNYTPKKTKYLSIEVVIQQQKQNAGANYASDPEARTEILGKLEEYTMDNMLGGITLFESGAYVRYSERVNVPALECIPGYGWGVLTEGSLDPTKPLAGEVTYPTYYQSASSSDALSINAWDATGSQVSDLFSYISSSYWGTRMASNKTSYEWYPVLAADKVDGKDFTRPIHLDPDNELKMYKKWRIYVKTGADIKYRTTSLVREEYDGQEVTIEDYEFIYQLLLSERSQLIRGSELAGDTTYGIKGAQTFFRRSKDIYDVNIDESTGKGDLDLIWDSLKASGELGISTGHDANNGDYIDIELVNAIDEFTAMYTLSSNLYTPIPKSYLRELGGGDYTKGALVFGSASKDYGGKGNFIDNTLCCGPYYLEKWEKNVETVFTTNDQWFEVGPDSNRYKIPGVVIRIMSGALEQDDYIYSQFTKAHILDSTSIPKSKMSEYDPATDRKVEGDSTFKLNVNSCTQERWNEINEDVWHNDDSYTVKPMMSNNKFLKGLYWSINRKEFASDRGANPSFNYFANTYMSDPENGVSYNSTPEHQAAVANFHDGEGEDDNYGFNITRSREYFKLACQELSEQGLIEFGTAANPKTYNIDIIWMYQSDIEDYGKDVKRYFETAFNDSSVTGGCVKLNVTNDAVFEWTDVYYKYLMIGKYDLGFGAISGNSYNPLNFLEVLKSDNSSGFTLNWGPDTSKVDETKPLVYENKTWSFDALWAAGDHGAVIKDGENVDPVSEAYVTDTASITGGKIYNGGTFKVKFAFVDVEEGVELKVDSVKIYLGLVGTKEVIPDNLATMIEDGFIQITISAEDGLAWNDEIYNASKDLQNAYAKATDETVKDKLRHPFRLDTYDQWWNIEIHYTLTINGGFPTENVKNVNFTKDEGKAKRLSSLACL